MLPCLLVNEHRRGGYQLGQGSPVESIINYVLADLECHHPEFGAATAFQYFHSGPSMLPQAGGVQYIGHKAASCKSSVKDTAGELPRRASPQTTAVPSLRGREDAHTVAWLGMVDGVYRLLVINKQRVTGLEERHEITPDRNPSL